MKAMGAGDETEAGQGTQVGADGLAMDSEEAGNFALSDGFVQAE